MNVPNPSGRNPLMETPGMLDGFVMEFVDVEPGKETGSFLDNGDDDPPPCTPCTWLKKVCTNGGNCFILGLGWALIPPWDERVSLEFDSSAGIIVLFHDIPSCPLAEMAE